jgi:penicillin-insensitive murein endopeptidase
MAGGPSAEWIGGVSGHPALHITAAQTCVSLFPAVASVGYTAMMRLFLALLLLTFQSVAALAQDKGTLDPQPLPPLANPADPKLAAKLLFGRRSTPIKMTPQAIGFYSNGCMAGGKALEINGPTWQVMRLSRNRNWGHPNLIAFMHRLARKVAKVTDWHGILVGDMSQPRGGPMLNGHKSHQVGLDADIWLRPMPDHELSRAEREEMSSTMVVREDRRDVDPKLWTPDHLQVIKAAAEDPEVERILVNAAIKKALCREAKGDRTWLWKVRPFWGHDYHMHVRIKCPPDSPSCKPQDPPKDDDGCGADLAKWFRPKILNPLPAPPPEEPAKPRPQLTLAKMPPACRYVVQTP